MKTFLLILVFIFSVLPFSSNFAIAKEHHKPKAKPVALPPIPQDSPYAKLKAHFDQASPMQLNQLLTPTNPELKKWSCAVVKRSAPTVVEDHRVPVRARGKVVIAQAKPGVPARGPLFPGTADTPEQDETVDAIFFTSPSEVANFNLSPSFIGNEYVDYGGHLATTPDLKMTWTKLSSVVSLRVHGNLIFYYAVSTDFSGYGYCWNNDDGLPAL